MSRDKPRVLFVDRQGALAIWSLMLPVAEALESQGWSAGIVSMTDDCGRELPPQTLALGATTIQVPDKRSGIDLWRQKKVFSRKFSDVLERLRPDVVHLNFAIPGIWTRRVARKLSVPWVLSTQHELAGSLSRHLRLGLWATRGCVDTHTYVSEAVAESFGVGTRELSPSGNAPPAHAVIRNGVDEEAIEAVANEAAALVPGRIVAPGRLVPVKGHRRILAAFAQVKDQYPDAELLISGSGPEESSLRRLAERLGITSAVRLMGWLPREKLWSLVASAQAAVFASDGTQEGFGLALAEAALLDTPLVASNIAAFREVLVDEDQAAWWFQPADADGLAQALMQVLSASLNERDRRVESARRAVKARATQRVMVDQYVQLYDRLAMSLAEEPDG